MFPIKNIIIMKTGVFSVTYKWGIFYENIMEVLQWE